MAAMMCLLRNKEHTARTTLSNLARHLYCDPGLKTRYDEVLDQMNKTDTIVEDRQGDRDPCDKPVV